MHASEVDIVGTCCLLVLGDIILPFHLVKHLNINGCKKKSSDKPPRTDTIFPKYILPSSHLACTLSPMFKFCEWEKERGREGGRDGEGGREGRKEERKEERGRGKKGRGEGGREGKGGREEGRGREGGNYNPKWIMHNNLPIAPHFLCLLLFEQGCQLFGGQGSQPPLLHLHIFVIA